MHKCGVSVYLVVYAMIYMNVVISHLYSPRYIKPKPHKMRLAMQTITTHA